MANLEYAEKNYYQLQKPYYSKPPEKSKKGNKFLDKKSFDAIVAILYSHIGVFLGIILPVAICEILFGTFSISKTKFILVCLGIIIFCLPSWSSWMETSIEEKHENSLRTMIQALIIGIGLGTFLLLVYLVLKILLPD